MSLTRAFQVGNLNTTISSFSWQRGIKKNSACKTGCWWEIKCFIKPVLRVLCCFLLAVCCKGNFQKSLNALWNVTCVVEVVFSVVQILKFLKELHEDVCACFNVINKGKCWVMSRCVLRVGGIWLSGERLDKWKILQVSKLKGENLSKQSAYSWTKPQTPPVGLQQTVPHVLTLDGTSSHTAAVWLCREVERQGRKIIFRKIQNSNIDYTTSATYLTL